MVALLHLAIHIGLERLDNQRTSITQRGRIMECVMCREPIPDNVSVCPHCESPVAAASTGTSAPGLEAIIDSLNISDQKKQVFHMINTHHLLEKKGGLTMIDIKKAKDAGISFKDRLAMLSVWGFLLSFIYYFVVGMWKKGLSILGLTLVIVVIEVVLDRNLIILNAIPSALSMMMAIGDQYRTKVLKEDFWF